MRTFVVGDLHLTSYTSAAAAGDFVRLLERCSGQRLLIAGDFFDLATEAPRENKQRTVGRVLQAHAAVRAALGQFVDGGGELWLCSGNHDSDLGDDAVRTALIDSLQAPADSAARIRSSPWFFREAGLHIEHGHFYDADNAPEHPLVAGQPPLGVHFSSEFVHPTGAHRYLSANDGTPLRLFLSSFAWYGPRAPYVIYRYFHAAASALTKSGPLYRAHHERHAGQERHAAFAAAVGVPAEMVEAVFAQGAAPTQRSFANTFARLYLDRVVASLLMATGLSATLLPSGPGRALGAASTTLGAMLMTLSWLHGHNRYGGTVVERLQLAADRIVQHSGAELVVFGHTHREALHDKYANTGSFAFPQQTAGRPYLEIAWRGGRPRPERRYLEGASA